MADIEPIVPERIKETCSRIMPSAGHARRDARTWSNTTIECPRKFKKGAPKRHYA
ncbi:hypothetical protein [Butyrivibrio sp. LC3010]|uniref:hypothetical protein n=1 Tax=Butyrivibrio sp. LC3010 TaxID=1280680 RepID=UPI0012DCACB1|nr:hypothetical protein [Butyrivibrio sp. LC3010]